MNYNNPLPSSISNAIRLGCSILFVVFCFVYLYCLQCDVLAEAQYVYSSGVTTYSRFWGALIITASLLCVQFMVSRATRLRGRWYALTFFPSFVLLAFVTSLNRAVITDFSLGQWIWALPLLAGVYLVFLYVHSKLPGESVSRGDYSLSRYLWPNFVVLFIMMVLCGGNASANDVFMYELKAERLLLQHDYEAASRVGEKSLVTSSRLNELRMYALAQQGLLGEKLFDYPQPYEDQSLLMMDDTVSRLYRFTAKDIQQALGAWANPSVTTFSQYIALLRQNPTTRHNPMLADYTLCGHLLRKDLRGFLRDVRKYYDLSTPDKVTALPKVYREAMLLQAKAIGQDSLNAFADTLMLSHYRDFCTIRDADDNPVVCTNRLRRAYGNTLWFYLE